MAQSKTAGVSDLRADERIVFFTTAAHTSADGRDWIVPIHGRIYRPERSVARKAVIARALKSGFGIVPDRESNARFSERVDLLLADNKGGRRIVVAFGTRDVALPVSGADGHFAAQLRLPASEVAPDARNGSLGYRARLAARDPRTFLGTVLLLQAEGVSVISDIDDTVKITWVTDTRRMLEATFLKPFEAVPGMARLYTTWSASGAAFHYVSSSPWHLYEPLSAFLDAAGFPLASIDLKKVRLKDGSIRNIVADSTITKPPVIEALLAAHPARRFVLVGDSGEKDPEIYGDVLRRHPARIVRVFIRNVTGAGATDARFTRAFSGIDPARWQLFTEADELPMSPK